MENTATTLIEHPGPGTLFKNRYEVVQFLGRGASGTVYACKDRMLGGAPIALKILHSGIQKDERKQLQVQNEISTAFNVNHQNVVQALGWFTDGPYMAYTMEYVPGVNLAQALTVRDYFSTAETTDILMQLCKGVAAIHEQEIIHRDLKPDNILIGSRNRVKITDFGVAVTSDTLGMSKETGIVGTHDYVSPEYITGNKIDFRTDIYSLGIIAYELLTGSTPFAADTTYLSFNKKVDHKFTPIRELRPDVPAALCAIVEKAMSCDPKDRYANATAFFEALSNFKENKTRSPKEPFRISKYVQKAINKFAPQPPQDKEPQSQTQGRALELASLVS